MFESNKARSMGNMERLFQIKCFWTGLYIITLFLLAIPAKVIKNVSKIKKIIKKNNKKKPKKKLTFFRRNKKNHSNKSNSDAHDRLLQSTNFVSINSKWHV